MNYFCPDFQALDTAHTVTNNTPKEIAIPVADWKNPFESAIFLNFKVFKY